MGAEAQASATTEGPGASPGHTISLVHFTHPGIQSSLRAGTVSCLSYQSLERGRKEAS